MQTNTKPITDPPLAAPTGSDEERLRVLTKQLRELHEHAEELAWDGGTDAKHRAEQAFNVAAWNHVPWILDAAEHLWKWVKMLARTAESAQADLQSARELCVCGDTVVAEIVASEGKMRAALVRTKRLMELNGWDDDQDLSPHDDPEDAPEEYRVYAAVCEALHQNEAAEQPPACGGSAPATGSGAVAPVPVAGLQQPRSGA